jgi:hypothetical protein
VDGRQKGLSSCWQGTALVPHSPTARHYGPEPSREEHTVTWFLFLNERTTALRYTATAQMSCASSATGLRIVGKFEKLAWVEGGGELGEGV